MHAEINFAVFHYDVHYNYSPYPRVVIRKMDKMCEYCDALKFMNKASGICCAGRKVKLPELY